MPTDAEGLKCRRCGEVVWDETRHKCPVVTPDQRAGTGDGDRNAMLQRMRLSLAAGNVDAAEHILALSEENARLRAALEQVRTAARDVLDEAGPCEHRGPRCLTHSMRLPCDYETLRRALAGGAEGAAG